MSPPASRGRWAGYAGAAVLVALYLAASSGGGGGKGRVPGSSFDTGPAGFGAWAELLSRYDHRVSRLRGDVRPADLDPGATVVSANVVYLPEQEQRALRGFVRAGGRLVALGHGSEELLEGIVEEPPRLGAAAPAVASPTGAVNPDTGAVREVRPGPGFALEDPGSLRPLLAGTAGEVVAAAGPVGDGRVVALAGTGPFENQRLALADNAALALAVVGSRPVAFLEGPHGYGRPQGFSALPGRWRATLAGLAVAGAVWMLARGRRFGPVEEASRALPPPRVDYVQAVASTLVRARQPVEAAEPVRRRIRRLVAARAGIPLDDPQWAAAAARFGLTETEIAGAEGAGGEDGVVAAGRALARLNDGGSPP